LRDSNNSKDRSRSQIAVKVLNQLTTDIKYLRKENQVLANLEETKCTREIVEDQDMRTTVLVVDDKTPNQIAAMEVGALDMEVAAPATAVVATRAMEVVAALAMEVAAPAMEVVAPATEVETPDMVVEEVMVEAEVVMVEAMDPVVEDMEVVRVMEEVLEVIGCPISARV
jgi:hypothetical protein